MTVLSYEESFASHEKSEFWHPTLNGDLTPRNVAQSNGKKHWFKCGCCNHSFDIIFYNVIKKGQWCSYCAKKKLCSVPDCTHCVKNSFASHEKSEFWHPTLNGDVTPRDVTKSCSKKFWFTCSKCNHDFDCSLCHVQEGNWCSYCANKKRCDINCVFCFNNSFASHEKSKFWHPTLNGVITPRDVAKSCNKKYWFRCTVCNHDFDSPPCHVINNAWCPYCAICSARLCEDMDCDFCHKKSFASCERSKLWNKTLNGEITPRDMCVSSGKKFWFTCEYCSYDFYTSLRHITNGRGCPVCRNKTEKKLLEYLSTKFPKKVKFQARYDWCKNSITDRYLPFDFEIFGSIIIELDGPQHIATQISNWKSPEEHQERDVYKMKCANENGYSVVRILQADVFGDTYDWKSELLEVLREYPDPTNIYLCKNDEYMSHRHKQEALTLTNEE